MAHGGAHGGGAFESLRPLGEGEPDVQARRDSSIVGLVGEDGRLDLAPRGVGRVLDTALELLRHRFALWVGVSAILWLPVRALQALVGPHVWAGGDPMNPFANAQNVFGMLAGLFVSQLALIGVQSLTTAYVALGVRAIADGRPFRPWTELGLAFRRVVGLIAIVFLTGLAAVVGMLMCFFPYVYVTFKLSLAPSAYIVEGVSVVESLRRSVQLTRASFLRWLGILVIAAIMVMPYSSLALFGDAPEARAAVLSALGISGGTLDAWLVPLTSLANAVATTLMSATMTVLYFDCRARRDGADLRRELELLGGGVAPAGDATGATPGAAMVAR